MFGSTSRFVLLAAAGSVLTLSACVFELRDLVTSSVGGAGGAATGGGGNAGGGGETSTGGSAASPTRTSLEVDTSLLANPYDFPLLVRVTPDTIDYDLAGADGANIRFYADQSDTPLPHDVDRWVLGGESLVWVKVPLSPGGDATLWMHVGVAQPSAMAPAAVWSDYVAVYHLGDDLPGPVRDATASAHDGAAEGLVAADSVEGVLAGSIDFNGVAGDAPSVNLGGDDAFRPPNGGALTLDMWFQRDEPTLNFGYLASMEGCCSGWGVTWVQAPLQLRGLIGFGGCCPATGSTYTFDQFDMPGGDTNADWHHYVLVLDRNNDQLVSYLDGQVVQTTAFASTSTEALSGSTLHLGANFMGEDGFDGRIDETRFSPRALPADWVAFQYANALTDLITEGDPEPIP